MKNICGCLGGQLYQPYKIRAFRRFYASRLFSKVTSRVFTGHLIRGSMRRFVSTDGKKRQQVLTQVVKPRPSFGVERFISPPKTTQQRTKVPVFSARLEKPRFSRKTASYGEILSRANSLQSSVFDPLSARLAFLPTFFSVQKELSGLFCAETPVVEGLTAYSVPVESCSIAVGESEKLDCEEDGKNNSNVGETQKKKTLLKYVPLTFDDVHNFKNKEFGGVNEESKNNSTIHDLPNLNNNCPSREFIIHTDRSSIIIHKDLYITNRILDKLKETEKKKEKDGCVPSEQVKAQSTDESGFLTVDKSDVNQSFQSESFLRHSRLPTGATESKSDTSVLVDPPNAESYISEDVRQVPTPAASVLNSRGNLYSQFLTNATSCSPIKGIHLKDVDQSGILNQVCDLSSNSKVEAAESNILLLPRDPKHEFGAENEIKVQEGGVDLTPENIQENVFIPIGREIESAVLSIPPSSQSIYSTEEFNGATWTQNEGNRVVSVNDFVNQVNEIGDGGIEVEGRGEKNSALMGENETNSTGGRYFHSKETPSSGTRPPIRKNVNVATKTVISCCKTENNTDINIKETQRYLDKRITYPFSTETTLQLYGTNSALRKAARAVESTKSKLVHMSDANVPNDGAAVFQLQFDLMPRERNADTKSRPLKIKMIQKKRNTSELQAATPPTSEVTSVPRALNVSNQPGLSSDVSKLVRRGKLKSGEDKNRKTMQQPSNRLTRDGVENIRILTPKELDQMFPSAPKPKFVERPRKVTIHNKVARKKGGSSANVAVKKRLSHDPATWKPRSGKMNVKDKLQKSSPKSVGVQGENPVLESRKKLPDATKKLTPTIEEHAGLSLRDKNILRNMISSRVRESFNAVNTKNRLEVKEAEDTRITKGSLLGLGVAVRAVGNAVISGSRETPKPAPSSSEVQPSALPDQAMDANSRTMEGTNETRKAAQATIKAENHSRPDNASTDTLFAQNSLSMPRPTNAVIAEILKKGSADPISGSRLLDHLPENNSRPILNEEAEKQFVQGKTPKSESVFNGNTASGQDLKGDGPGRREESNEAGVDISPQSNNKIMSQTGPNKLKITPSSEPLVLPFETPSLKESNIMADVVPVASHNSTHEPDFCKLCQESPVEPSMAVSYQVPLTRVKEFPMVNHTKKKSISHNSTPLSINQTNNPMLVRTLTGLPAVTQVLGTTLSSKSQQALDIWKNGLVTTLGDSGFKAFYHDQLKRGKAFHAAVKKYLSTESYDPLPNDLTYLSMAHVLKKISDVHVIESLVVHPVLAYRGVIDCVARYKGKLVAIEWKRSDKSKPTIKHTFDTPLQLSAYIGALNFDQNYKLQVQSGLIVVAYSDGSPADVHELRTEDCERFWAKWLKRLYQFHARQ